RQRAGFLVDRYDPAGMNGHGVFVLAGLALARIDHFVIGIDQLQSGTDLDGAEKHDVQMQLKDILQEALIHPHRANRAAAVADERLKNLEAATPGRAQPAALDAAGNRHVLTRGEIGDGLKMAAIFIPKRKAVQEIFDGGEADPLKIGRASWSDAF